MKNKLPVAGLRVLADFVGSAISNAYSAAGSNDMDQGVFASLSDSDRNELLLDYNLWDKVANPDGWEPTTRFSSVPDFAWAAYYLRRVRDSLPEIRQDGLLISSRIEQLSSNNHVFIVIECPDRPTLSIDLVNHHGRRGMGIRVNGTGVFNVLADLSPLPPSGAEKLFRFCSMCGEKLQLASSRPHQCKEEDDAAQL